jgi:Cellulase M and related proteins
MNKLLEKLFNAFGASSREDEIRGIIKSEIEAIKDSTKANINIEKDNIGNLIVKIGEGIEKLMVCTHMDKLGIMATLIENSGFIRFSPIGNIKPEKMVGMLIKFQNNVVGRIDSVKSNPLVEDLFIDIGVNSKEDAKKQIKEGDIAELIGSKFEMNGRIIAPNLHSNLSSYILLQIIREISSLNNLSKEIYFVFSAQSYMGFLGSRVAAFEIKPNVAIVLDALEAKDYTGGKGDIKLDGGPIINIFDKSLVIHHEVKGLIESSAENLNIKVQYYIGSGKNEGGLIHKEVGGIKTGMIGIPCRYIDTPEEMMSLKDVEDTRNLIIEFIKNINSEELYSEL